MENKISEKATQEIEKLKKEIESLMELRAKIQESCNKAENWYERQALGKEVDQTYNKILRKEEKVREIENIGFSPREVNAIVKESSSFTLLESDRGLGYRCSTKAGVSKVAGGYVKIQVHRYTDFMRNVKGCSSLADTKHVNYIVRITKEKFDELVEKGRKVSTSFLATETKIVPIPKK